jgi:thioredoxin-related protein
LVDSSRGAEKDQVTWRTDYDAARKESTDKNLPLFISFSSDDCVHCRRLENGPFRDAAVLGLLNERFIPLKLEAKLAPKLAQALRIQVYPTMIVAATDGKIIGFLEGYLDAKPLADNMGRCLALVQPDELTRDYQDAAKALANNDVPKALTLLKGVVADGKERPVQVQARQALQEIDRQAAGRLALVKQLHEKGQANEALDALTELLARYPGTPTATEGAKLQAKLADDPALRGNQRSRRARDLLAQAREALKAEKYNEALDLCDILESTYKDLPEATQGATLAQDIRANPDQLAKACANLNERLAFMYAALGDTLLKKGEREQAALNFEKAVRAAPASVVARDAQAKLAAITVKTFGTPVNLQKPERKEP